MAEKKVKKRNWSFLLYPESAPVDWLEQLKITGLPVAISPLHDMDVWSLEDEQKNSEHRAGTPKKAHHHVIVCYDGPTTFSSVKSLTDRLNQPIPVPLETVRGMYDYLTHEGQQDKYQYDKKDIQTLNGFDIREFVELTKSEVTKAKREILQLIRDNSITEYADLIDILMDGGEGTADMFDVASNNTLFFKAYLTSQWRRQAAPGRPPENEEGKGPTGGSAPRRENREPPR